MTWTHIKPNRDLMLSEQWLLRVNNAPVCSLKRDPERLDGWQGSFLNLSGVSCVVAHTTASTLQEAQRNCEKELREMGWRWGVQNEEVE